jgi:cell shape-determining protein MreC
MAKVQVRISMNKTHRGQKVKKYNVLSLENKEFKQALRNKIIELHEITSAVEKSQKGREKQWSMWER